MGFFAGFLHSKDFCLSVTKRGIPFAMVGISKRRRVPFWRSLSWLVSHFRIVLSKFHNPCNIMDEESNMLVLSRKVGQELVIGDNIRITVNRVGGSRVTLGIEAPNEVRIVRAELEPIVRSFEQADETKERRETKLPDSSAVNPTVLVDTSKGLTDVSSHLQS